MEGKLNTSHTGKYLVYKKSKGIKTELTAGRRYIFFRKLPNCNKYECKFTPIRQCATIFGKNKEIDTAFTYLYERRVKWRDTFLQELI